MTGADIVGRGDAIGPAIMLTLAVPQEQMPVVRVEAVEVARPAGALAGGAERPLAKPADFLSASGAWPAVT